VNCVWLQPFYPSPNRDDGYDITDYYNVDPRLGTLGDFVEFSRRARENGIRVMADLVVNHTSIDHPWFQQARRNPDSPYRDYYVWSKSRPEDAAEGMVFPGYEKSTWSWDEEAQAYYFHRFYSHEAELNITSREVRREIEKITGYWLQLGVTGFRVDALPYLIELRGLPDVAGRDPYEYLHDMRVHIQTLCGDACIMGEANLAPEDVPHYFGTGDKIHMSFNFYVNQHFFLALARQKAEPIRRAYDTIPQIPRYCQWANFLRTHDELDLGRLGEDERQEVFCAFGPEKDMQLYNRGLRRRLAPMLGNDKRRLELAHSLLLTLPGTPVLRYGDEIGMGDDLSQPERRSVRTPMQWSSEENAGFSGAPRERLVLPVIEQGEYGYHEVNVEKQRRDPESLLNWLERALRHRKERPEFGLGSCTWLDTGDPAVLAHRCDWKGSRVFAVHNLSSEAVSVTLSLGEESVYLHEVLGDRSLEVKDGRQRIDLEPFGYRWYRAAQKP
jgi:maltose alpha-D-glucosyltransferase/alpha-amylase